MELNELSFSSLHLEIEERCSSDILRIFKNNVGVCLYKLYADSDFNDVEIIFKIIVNQQLDVKITSQNCEYQLVDKLSSWTQLNELIEKYMDNDESEEILETYEEIIEETQLDNASLEQLTSESIPFESTEEIIEEVLDIDESLFNPFQCANCQIIFKNAVGLQHHILSCSTKKDIYQKCKICDQEFSTNLQLRLHMKTHEGQKRLKCSYCQKTVVNNGSLQRHIKAIHLKQRPHKW